MKYQHGRRVRPGYQRARGALIVSVSTLIVAGVVQHSSAAVGGVVDMPAFIKKGVFTRVLGAKTKKSGENQKGSSHSEASSPSTSTTSATTPSAPESPAQAAAAVRSTDCDLGNATSSLSRSFSSQLRAVAAYEAVCSAGIISTASFFAPTPTTSSQATSDASDIVAQLREFAKYGIRPVIFLEPTQDGAILNLNDYKAGKFDAALETYFDTIKKAGISDAQMGTWVSFPEGNIPVWNNVDPGTYAANVTKTMQIMKKYFPGAKAGLLLDSASYPNGTSWSGGKYVSLAPYVQSIPKGLIDSFGLQGFPWAPPAGQTGASYEPTSYLKINEAAEAANILGTKQIWLNTGTFGRSYANTAKQVTVSPAKRQVMLDGVIAQANSLKRQGYSVAIHLFSEDKSGTSEGIDWSYLNDPQATDVFKVFVHDSNNAGLPIWLFDTK